MTDDDVTRLERTGDPMAVSSPSPTEMTGGARRPRRRNAALAALAVAAVCGIIVGTVALAVPDVRPSPEPVDGSAESSAAEPVPAGTRLVGVGGAAIAVPQDWATNALRCGTATEPTVVVDVTVIEGCGWWGPRLSTPSGWAPREPRHVDPGPSPVQR